MRNRFLTLALCLYLANRSLAAEWEALTADLVRQEKPGFGGVSGVVVDRATGDLFIWLSDKGMYHSGDQGQTWKPFGKPSKGRTETPNCILTNPTGPLETFIIPLVYGGPTITSNRTGESWTTMGKQTVHVDWVAVDWSDSARRFVLTLKHESGGVLLASDDGGTTFHEVGKNFGFAALFDNKTAVVARTEPGGKPKTKKTVLMRTSDGCQTFEPVGEFNTKALPVLLEKTAYWLTDSGLIRSKDQGKTWQRLGAVKGGISGPVFGKDARHLFVLTTGGILESRDGGSQWAAPIPLPTGMKGASTLSWLAYDAPRDVLYVMKMGSELYRLRRSQ
jgi:photosystem II stability/assembly factor-like uncharacterized protein